MNCIGGTSNPFHETPLLSAIRSNTGAQVLRIHFEAGADTTLRAPGRRELVEEVRRKYISGETAEKTIKLLTKYRAGNPGI